MIIFAKTGSGQTSGTLLLTQSVFMHAGVKGVVRDVLLPWYNAYRFFVQSARRYPGETGKAFVPNEVRKTGFGDTFDV